MNYNESKKLKKGDCVWYLHLAYSYPDEYEVLFSTIERVLALDNYWMGGMFRIKIRKNNKTDTKTVYEKQIFSSELSALEYLSDIKSQQLERENEHYKIAGERIVFFNKQLTDLNKKIEVIKNSK